MDISKRHHVRIHDCQSDTTLVFVHGFGCDQKMWRRLAPQFETGFRIVLFDLVGAGSSDLSAYDEGKYGTLHGHALDLVDVIKTCTSGSVIVVSHSVGSMIALLASITQPSLIDAHIMVGPSPCYISDDHYDGGFTRADIDDLLETLDANYLGWSRAMAPAIMGAPLEPELGQELVDSFCRTDPAIAQHFAHVTFLSDHRDELAKNTVPTLILQSSDDIIAPMAVGKYMRRVMPHAELAVIQNTGHCPHMSAPDSCFSAMTQFLKVRRP